MATFIANDDEGYHTQGINFCAKIDNYTVLLNLNPDAVKQVKYDFAWFGYCYKGMLLFREYAQSVTAFKDIQRHGFHNQLLGEFPAPPVLATAPTDPTSANAQGRFAALIQQIVKSNNFSKIIAQDLGIDAPDTPFDPQAGKPLLKTSYSSGGHPHIMWKKGKYQGIEIWKDAADGKGWQKLDKDFHPDFTDKSPLPEAGKSAVWKYKAIYIYQDEVVGDWSEEVAVTVHGSV